MSLAPPTTLRGLIIQSGRKFGAAEFIRAGGRAPLTYTEFAGQREYVERELRAAGMGPGSRVAVKIPNGPELASCLLCVMASAVCVPIHSDVRAGELDQVAADLHLDAIVLAAKDAMSEAAYWTARGVEVIALHADGAAGRFTLHTGPGRGCPPPASMSPSDTAMIMLTSGSTASPKRVPVTQAGVVNAAIQSSKFFRHTQEDCGLAIMPLNHGQGLMVSLLPVMVSGSSVVCGEKLDPGHFFELYETFEPTWFTAIPTFYQALLKYASGRPPLNNHRLRYIRTGSAHMPASVMQEARALFGVPVLMGYGSAETCHITNNPIPPRINKPGTVGVPYDNEVAIMDADGNHLGPHVVGEVVVRGKSVTPGYLENPGANADLFMNGWLRTGDRGRLDQDGYLTLVGRIKDQVNRGGESISTLEVEEAIGAHPSVAGVAVFAVEHPTLGEDIAAAVVCQDGGLSESALTDYLSGFLNASKIPREYLFLDALPLTDVGKIDKSNLPGMLLSRRRARRQERAAVRPRTECEETLERIWTDVLKVPQVSVTDRFLDIGGDSMSAIMIINRISDRIGGRLAISSLLSSATIAEQARQIQHLLGDQPEHHGSGQTITVDTSR